MYYCSKAVNIKASPILLLSSASRTNLETSSPRSSNPAWSVALVSASPCKPREDVTARRLGGPVDR